MTHLELIARLAQPAESKIVLLVLDGLGDIRTRAQPETALEAAATPHLDALAARSTLGRLVPVATGVTPGSGPGHLALFGYDPTSPEADIGRGPLEALGVGIDLRPGDVVARGNFATLDDEGRVTDRRAGRISTEENRRLTAKLERALAEHPPEGLDLSIYSGEGHRFVLLARGEGLSPAIGDTDPQEAGVPPRPLEATDEAARTTAERLAPALETLRRALADEPRANGFLLRGFDTLPHLPGLDALYGLHPGCFAGYPLYRGVARLCGMEVVEVGKEAGEILDRVARRWDDFDFLFLHVKGTDKAGEDGDQAAKVRVIEDLDGQLPRLLERLDPARDVLAITGDHSTPAPMKLHSWHPVPLLLHGPFCSIDGETTFSEQAAARGHVGTIPSRELMGLLLANAERLAKFGA